MSKLKKVFPYALGLIFMAALFPLATEGQETTGIEKVAGVWNLQVDAGEEYFSLTLELKMTEGRLEGMMSESSGIFSNVPLSEVQFADGTLTFEFISPTPPDGVERLIKAELKVEEDRMEGMLNVPEIGAMAPASATKEKK